MTPYGVTRTESTMDQFNVRPRRDKAVFVVDAYMPANEMAELVSLNMVAPVRIVSDMRDNQKTPNRNGVYIYNRM